MLPKIIPAILGLALCAAANGCVVTHEDPPESPMGTLTTSWTLNGSAGPDACGYYQVDRVHVTIVDEDGFVIVDEEPFCEDFDVSVDLSVGWYSSEVTLLDFGGHGVSDTVVTDVRVVRNTEAFVDVDFPAASIF
jgi:hypothetical protein